MLVQKQVLWQSALLVFGPNVLNKTLPGASISVVAAQHRGLELQPGPPRGAGSEERGPSPAWGEVACVLGVLSLRPGCESMSVNLAVT